MSSSDLERLDPRHEAALQRADPPPSLLQIAIQRGVDAEQLSRLMDLQERQDKARAAAAFGEAMTRFQSLMPIIRKKRAAEFNGRVQYHFAGYDDINRVAGPILAQCGLVVTFDIADAGPGKLGIICHVRHGTHVEDTKLTLPIPDIKVNDTQKYGAAVQYAKRYSFCAALNIIISDEDDDAATMLNVISEDEAEQLKQLLNQTAAATGMQIGNFMGWLKQLQPGCEQLEDVAARNLPQVTMMLKHKMKQKTGGAK